MFIETRPWWHSDFKGQRHKHVISLVKELYGRQVNRYLTFRRNISIYEYGYRASMRLTAKERFVDDQILFYNLAANAIDTYVSSMCTPQLSVMALTEGGTYSDRQRAKLITKAAEGTLDEIGFVKNKYFAIRDFSLVGRGITKLFITPENTLSAERVMPIDIIVDDSESRFGCPRTMYQRDSMDRFQAMEIYGEDNESYVGTSEQRRKAIAAATNFIANIDDDTDVYDNDTQITVIEAYHLPSTPTSNDGLHVLCVEGCDLIEEPWELPFFPYATFCPKPPTKGWWGVPIMRMIAPAQRERERVDFTLQKAVRRMGGSHWLVHQEAQMDIRQISNDSGDIYEWAGTIPPQTITPQPINQQILDYRESIANDILRFIGRSPFAAQSQLPAGLQQASGRALNVFEQVENKRDVVDHAELERYTLESVTIMFALIRKIVETDPSYAVKFSRGQNKYESFKWKEVLLPEDQCKFRVFPVSSLSQDPAAKFDELEKLFNAQLITSDQFKRLYGIPDIESDFELDEADLEIIQSNLDHMIMTGEYMPVEPFDDPKMILNVGRKFYNVCRRAGVKEERLALIRNYLLDAKAELERANVGAGNPVPGSEPTPGGEQPTEPAPGGPEQPTVGPNPPGPNGALPS